MSGSSNNSSQTSLVKRKRTECVVVHFKGAEETSYQQIKQTHLETGSTDIGFHYIIESDGKTLMGRHFNNIEAPPGLG